MQRIARIVGSSPSAPRGAGWLTPMVMAISITTAVGSCFGDEDESTPSQRDGSVAAIDYVDIVALVGSVDPAQARTLQELRAHGLDNSGLMLVLQKLGTDERVVRAIESAVKHMKDVQRQLDDTRKDIQSAVAAGQMTPEEARRAMEKLHRHVAEAGKKSTHRALRKQRHEATIDEMRSRGMSPEEIHQALGDLERVEYEEAMNRKIAEMEKKGLSKEEIDVVLQKQRFDNERAAQMKHQDEMFIKELQANGHSEDEIKRALTRRYEDRDREKQREMARRHEWINEMRLSGLSDDEIHRNLELRKKAQAAEKQANREKTRLEQLRREGHSPEEIQMMFEDRKAARSLKQAWGESLNGLLQSDNALKHQKWQEEFNMMQRRDKARAQQEVERRDRDAQQRALELEQQQLDIEMAQKQ